MVATLLIVVSQPATPAKTLRESLPAGSLMTDEQAVQTKKRMVITRTAKQTRRQDLPLTRENVYYPIHRV